MSSLMQSAWSAGSQRTHLGHLLQHLFRLLLHRFVVGAATAYACLWRKRSRTHLLHAALVDAGSSKKFIPSVLNFCGLCALAGQS